MSDVDASTEEGELRSPVPVKVKPISVRNTGGARNCQSGTRRAGRRRGGKGRKNTGNNNNFERGGNGEMRAPERAGVGNQVPRNYYHPYDQSRRGNNAGSNGKVRAEPQRQERVSYYVESVTSASVNPFYPNRDAPRGSSMRGAVHVERAQIQQVPPPLMALTMSPVAAKQATTTRKSDNVSPDNSLADNILAARRDKFRRNMITLLSHFQKHVDEILEVQSKTGQEKFQKIMIRSFFALSLEKHNSSEANRERLAKCLQDMVQHTGKVLANASKGEKRSIPIKELERLSASLAPADTILPFWLSPAPGSSETIVPEAGSNLSPTKPQNCFPNALPDVIPFANLAPVFNAFLTTNNLEPFSQFNCGFASTDQDDRVINSARAQAPQPEAFAEGPKVIKNAASIGSGRRLYIDLTAPWGRSPIDGQQE